MVETLEKQVIVAPFKLPVRFDREEMVIVDAGGTVVCDTGRWMPQDDEPKLIARANHIIKVLNGDIVVLKDFKTGEIMLEDGKEFLGAEK